MVENLFFNVILRSKNDDASMTSSLCIYGSGYPLAFAKLKNPERLGTKPVKDTPSKDTAIREAFGFSKPQKTGSRMSRKGPFLLV